jgi:hypothetical protein
MLKKKESAVHGENQSIHAKDKKIFGATDILNAKSLKSTKGGTKREMERERKEREGECVRACMYFRIQTPILRENVFFLISLLFRLILFVEFHLLSYEISLFRSFI